MTSEYVPCSTGAKSRTAITGACVARGCTGNARGGKPFCPDHVERNPYVAALMIALAAAPEPVWLPKVDLTELKFGRWLVTGLSTYTRGYWDVVCECGHAQRVAGTSLIQEKSRGCRGCAMRDRHKARRAAEERGE